MTFNEHINYLIEKNAKGEVIYLEELLSLADSQNLTKDMIQVLIKVTYHAARFQASIEELESQKELFNDLKKIIK